MSQHFDRLQEVTEQGVVLLAEDALNTDSTCFGIVIFNDDTEEATRRMMSDDPAGSETGRDAPPLFPCRVALMAGKKSE